MSVRDSVSATLTTVAGTVLTVQWDTTATQHANCATVTPAAAIIRSVTLQLVHVSVKTTMEASGVIGAT